MIVYVIYVPYSDGIIGVYSDKGRAYKKAFEFNILPENRDSTCMIFEGETEHKEAKK